MNKLIFLILIIVFCTTPIQAQKETDFWEYRTGQIFFKYQGTRLVCRHRVVLLAEEMKKRGEVFDVVFGWKTLYTNKTVYHVWIEYQNRILETTNTRTQEFKEYARWRINQNRKIHELLYEDWCVKVLKQIREGIK